MSMQTECTNIECYDPDTRSIAIPYDIVYTDETGAGRTDANERTFARGLLVQIIPACCSVSMGTRAGHS
jgi:hypothetical protein